MKPLNILSFGAVAGGEFDNTDRINYALAVGKAQGQHVLVPIGIFAYSDVLTADSVQLVGEGEGSVLYALNTDREAIYMRGIGAGVRHLKLSGVVPTQRMSPWECSRVVAREGASKWAMEDITVETSSAAGLVAEGASDGRIIGCRVTNTLADAIHMTNKTCDVLIAGNTVESAGDDGIAVVSYQGNGGYVERITARHNHISNNLHGRTMSVVGGRNIIYENNMLEGNPGAAGFYVSQEDSWSTYGAHNVTLRRNSLYNVGGDGESSDHTAILVFSDSYEKNTDIIVERNVIVFDRANAGGLRDYSEDEGVAFDSNVLMGCTPDYRISFPDLIKVVDYCGGPVGMYP